VFLWSASFGLLYFYSINEGAWKYFDSGGSYITAINHEKGWIVQIGGTGEYTAFRLRNAHTSRIEGLTEKEARRLPDGPGSLKENWEFENSFSLSTLNQKNNGAKTRKLYGIQPETPERIIDLIKLDDEKAKDLFVQGFIKESEARAYQTHKRLQAGGNIFEEKPKNVKHYFLNGLLDPELYKEYLRKMKSKDDAENQANTP
jgi:hypothetical protein